MAQGKMTRKWRTKKLGYELDLNVFTGKPQVLLMPGPWS
jgi:hypothetical protein